MPCVVWLMFCNKSDVNWQSMTNGVVQAKPIINVLVLACLLTRL
jgi:hypothetical protein